MRDEKKRQEKVSACRAIATLDAGIKVAERFVKIAF
jgi:hypothetical protein